MINATISCIYSFSFTPFLISIFDVRRYSGAYLGCAYVPRLMKLTTFMDELVEKNKSISSSQESYKILP